MSANLSFNQCYPLVCPVPIRVMIHNDVAQILSEERLKPAQVKEAFDSYLAIVKQCNQPCSSPFNDKVYAKSSYPEYSLWGSRRIVQWNI
jgi:hypothetical protein